MMSYLIKNFGAYSTEGHGDIYFDQLLINPILLRESNFGRNIPKGIPHLPFSTSLSAFAFLINDSTEKFGWEDTGWPSEIMNFVDQSSYGPIILDLAALDSGELENISEKLGKSEFGAELNSQYGIVYYENLDQHNNEDLKNKLTITSRRLFGADVTLE